MARTFLPRPGAGGRAGAALVAACLAGALLQGPAAAQGAAPGFDCRYARFAAEVAVCRSGTLAALDREINRVFDALPAQVRARIEPRQALWRRERNACRDNEVCIYQAYDRRIVELEALTR